MSATPRLRPSPAPEVSLTVQSDARVKNVPNRGAISRWVRAALHCKARLTVRIMGAREARRLNREFRDRDYATNVLTFVYSARGTLEGDIALCAPVIAREARELGIAVEARYAHMIVHGVLHLQGYDHLQAPEARRMERLETSILARLGYSDPYRNQAIGAAAGALQ